MTRLRAAAQCIGAVQPNGKISVITDFFGYTSARGPTQAGQKISVLAQMRLLEGPHLHLNIIQVGFELFWVEDLRLLDGAVAVARSIFAAAGIGVGRVRPYYISDSQAAEAGVTASWITFDDEASALTDMFTIDNDALDVFIVLNWGIFSDNTVIGRSAVGGPCDKDDDACDMTGTVVELSGSAATVGATMAHEIGHYLGLEHVEGLSADEIDFDGDGTAESHEIALFSPHNANLMFPVNAGGTAIRPAQAMTMMGHCFMKPGC